tara:strand:+ start:873 stop:1061 length:189 start_codon:yes stop_codon:yes gene_type:complete
MGKFKENIFTESALLKQWATELSDACGSVLINKKPNVSRIDSLIERFVNDYNHQMENRKEEE